MTDLQRPDDSNYYPGAPQTIRDAFWHEAGRTHKRGLFSQIQPESQGDERPMMLASSGVVNLPDCPDHFPTDQRSFMRADIDQAEVGSNGRTYVLAVPGYSGTDMTTFGGDIMGVLTTAALQEGHDDLTVLGINDSGRGTSGFMKEQGRLARVSRKDQIADAERTTEALINAGEIMGNERDGVVIVGHSLGQPKGLGALEAILKKTPMRVQAIVNLMGVSDERCGLVRSGRFLGSVFPHAPKAVWQAWLAYAGAMDLIDYSGPYAKAMFGLPKATDETEAHRKVAALDSARAFLDVTMQWDTSHLGRLMTQFGDRLSQARIVTVTARDENLLPDLTAAQSKHYKKLGLREAGKVEVPTSHSIPLHLTTEQQAAFHRAFRLAFKKD